MGIGVGIGRKDQRKERKKEERNEAIGLCEEAPLFRYQRVLIPPQFWWESPCLSKPSLFSQFQKYL